MNTKRQLTLRPCPFCWGETTITHIPGGRYGHDGASWEATWKCICTDCGMSAKNGEASPELAAAAWNRRAPNGKQRFAIQRAVTWLSNPQNIARASEMTIHEAAREANCGSINMYNGMRKLKIKLKFSASNSVEARIKKWLIDNPGMAPSTTVTKIASDIKGDVEEATKALRKMGIVYKTRRKRP